MLYYNDTEIAEDEKVGAYTRIRHVQDENSCKDSIQKIQVKKEIEQENSVA
jgi:hypothetical protein